MTGNAWFGFAHFFGDEALSQPNDCVLRMKSGSTEFDPKYYVDLNQAANTPAVYHTWQSTGRGVVAAVWELYMLVSEGSPDPGANARSSLYRIAGSEAVLAFSTTGDIWSIGRVR